MSGMNVQAESSTSDNTSASTRAMEDAQIQANVRLLDLDSTHKVLAHILFDNGILPASSISSQLTTPKPNKEPATFMSLPGELRNRIYREYFAPQGTALDEDGERRIHPIHPDDIDTICVKDTDTLVSWATPESGRKLDVNLLFTCKQAYGEAKGILFEQRLVQVRMQGSFHRYVAQALREALRVELRLDWYNSSPSRPRQFVEILEARNDLQEFALRIGHKDRALMNVSRVEELFEGVSRIRASKAASLVWTGAEEELGSDIAEYHAFIRNNEAVMVR